MSFILWLPSVLGGPFWDTFWYLGSKVYSEDVFLAVLPIFSGVADRSCARFFCGLFLVQMWLNVGLNGLVNVPRPPEGVGIRIHPVNTGGGYAFPSGHAQGSAAVNRLPRWLRLALAPAVPAAMLWAGAALPPLARVGLRDQYAALGALAGIWLGMSSTCTSTAAAARAGRSGSPPLAWPWSGASARA